MYKFILLDLDNTILDFDAAEAVALRKAFIEVGIEPTQALLTRYAEINQAEWERYERGEVSRDVLLVERYDLLFAQFGIALPGHVCEDAYRKYLGVGHYFVSGAVELLDYLTQKGYLLYLASNGVADTQNSRLDSAGIRPYFQDIFISETTGCHKPEQAYFDYCFAHIPNFSRKQALLIGDSLTSDVLGGKRAGIATCWFHRDKKTAPPELAPDYEVHTLEEIRTIL